MKKMLLGVAVLGLAMLTTFSMTVAQDKGDKKAKHTIKEVMKAAHKQGLLKKVTSGDASADEKKQLVALYEDLGKNDPPKGDKKGWEDKTTALVKAAKEAADGKGVDNLKKSSNCAACHKEHKG